MGRGERIERQEARRSDSVTVVVPMAAEIARIEVWTEGSIVAPGKDPMRPESRVVIDLFLMNQQALVIEGDPTVVSWIGGAIQAAADRVIAASNWIQDREEDNG